MVCCHPISIASCKIVTHECVLSWRFPISSRALEMYTAPTQSIGNIYHGFRVKKICLKRKGSYVSGGKLENKCHSPNKACLFVLATTHRSALTYSPIYHTALLNKDKYKRTMKDGEIIHRAQIFTGSKCWTVWVLLNTHTVRPPGHHGWAGEF